MTYRTRTRTRTRIISAFLFVSLAALPAAQAAEPRAVTVVRGLVSPWALAFLPDGRMLVT